MTINLIDNHLQDSRFDEDRKQVLHQARTLGIQRVVCNGTRPEDWQAVGRTRASGHRDHPLLRTPRL